ncbi:guanine nucleotide-binding protein G(I)/G(S)/G(O) subunit gamma-12a [Poecilia latipinna]|uniref:Guanine nucleotide-binding protein subunit gamma n=1 Tax=Poecilia latipinna TaxID=48699 RepID=A0A3B3TTH3_9TELE|nr:PREDICTED: guanine nucleotide-binding protein G(I)/G(S)/G(O) subunit gamma-12-like [Poecilia latipinna]XP_014905592.1 PREDICTED: guanine nucleotide-binding protein G(I)/G(S)/G(O) subunit gamma-12-like [Poecilia latipinna]
MSSKAPSANNLNQARQTVQQLRLEAKIERIKISQASADIVKYCCHHQKSDPLIAGIPASENPFKEKKPCTLL